MTIVLPRFRRQTDFKLRKVSASSVAVAATGGARLPLNRAGDHWAIEVEAGVLAASCGREMLADIVQGSITSVRAYVPQIGIDPGTVGAPRVKGASQWGSALIIDGLTPALTVKKGWFFTVARTVLPSLHIVTAAVVADGTGEATVAFWPPLRSVTADNEIIEIIDPWIQGSIEDGGDHDAGAFAALSLGGFTIEEDG